MDPQYEDVWEVGLPVETLGGQPNMAHINTLIFVIALVYFMVMAWISLSFFRTDDGGAKKGKLFISSTIGIAVCVTLWLISRSTAGAVTFKVAAIGLFGYAFYILFLGGTSQQQTSTQLCFFARGAGANQ